MSERVSNRAPWQVLGHDTREHPAIRAFSATWKHYYDMKAIIFSFWSYSISGSCILFEKLLKQYSVSNNKVTRRYRDIQ